ncbi:sensor histidine kinase [Thalassolituus sp. LLYu03]|uniref:sensor histidine kinase n=1 Tax=Thalassolituus sp. LLYu03 TaxID=3421656 RepID=UPI003D28AEE1
MKEIQALKDQQAKLKGRAVVLVFLAAVFSLVVGTLVYTFTFSKFKNSLTQQQNTTLDRASAAISATLGDAGRIVGILYNSAGLHRALGTGNAADKEILAEEFSGVAKALGLVLQVRWLNAAGMEIARVDRQGDQIVVVAQEKLQRKSDRYYFREAMELPAGVRYFSPIDLNVENGAVVVPYQPTVRAGLRTGEGDGLQEGLILINYELGGLLERLRLLSQGDVALRMADNSGKWLLHENPQQEWGADTGRRDVSAATDMPGIWKRVVTQGDVLGAEFDRGIVSHQLLALPGESGVPELHLLAVTPADVVDAASLQALLAALFWVVLIIVCGLLLIWFDWRTGHAQLELAIRLKQDKIELKGTNDRLERSLRELSMLQDEVVETRKLSSLGMMVAGVAHELNTPVGGALMMSSEVKSSLATLRSALNEGGLTRQDFDDYLERTGRSVELLYLNLNRAKATVMGFKRLASDRVNEEVADFDLAMVVDDLINSYTPMFKREQVRVVNDVPQGISLHGYAGFMSQILQNLMLNALQHAFAGISDRRIRLQAIADRDSVIISVMDNGRGVSEEVADKLFDPFVTTRRGEGSTGLGMYLVHQWVTNLMHGTISTGRAPEGGLLVTLQIPKVMTSKMPSHAADLH